MALSTTTLSSAVTAGGSLWSLASSSGLSLPSIVAGLDPVRMLFCDGEAVTVTGFVGNNTVQVERAQLGSRAGAHASGATVYLARASELYQADPVGVPPTTPAVTPWINTVTGTVWNVSGGVWVPATSTTTTTATATAAYPKTTSGAQTLLASAAVARTVIISVQVTEAFANGDGAQPTFTIGETSAATKFAAAARFTGAAAGATFSFSGTLTASTALLVTGVAATGTTSTGAITVTVIAVPA